MTDDLDVQVIPAEPGWSVLHPVIGEDDQPVEFWSEAVVAWAVEVAQVIGREDWFTVAEPVLAASVGKGGYDCILQRPDGRIVFVEDRTFEDEDAALDYLREKRTRRAS